MLKNIILTIIITIGIGIFGESLDYDFSFSQSIILFNSYFMCFVLIDIYYKLKD